MKKKSLLILGFVGVISLSIGFMKDLAFAQTNEGDVVRVVTVEEQEIRENPTDGDQTTVITAEEQNAVENSTVQSGFVKQENGTGFLFEKVK